MRENDGLRLSITHPGGQVVDLCFDGDETAALRDWLMLVPHPGEESRLGEA